MCTLLWPQSVLEKGIYLHITFVFTCIREKINIDIHLYVYKSKEEEVEKKEWKPCRRAWLRGWISSVSPRYGVCRVRAGTVVNKGMCLPGDRGFAFLSRGLGIWHSARLASRWDHEDVRAECMQEGEKGTTASPCCPDPKPCPSATSTGGKWAWCRANSSPGGGVSTVLVIPAQLLLCHADGGTLLFLYIWI